MSDATEAVNVPHGKPIVALHKWSRVAGSVGVFTAFESVSAFATVGLSTGVTADLPEAAEIILSLLMFVGRLGPLTIGTALALRERRVSYEFPKERPAIG